VKAVLLKAMAKHSSDRWVTIGEFGNVLSVAAEKVL
jgi:hypothetical protein